MREVLKIVKRDGTPEPFAQTIDFPERDAIIGLHQVQALEERFLRLRSMEDGHDQPRPGCRLGLP